MKKLNRFNLVIICQLFTALCFAESDQYIGGQIQDSPMDKIKTEGDSPFISGKSKDSFYNKGKGNSYNISGKSSSDWVNKQKGESILFNNSPKYLEFNNKNIMKDIYKKSDNAWSFTYLYDTFDYTDKDNLFKKIFQNENSAKSIQSGYLSLHYRRYLKRRGDVDFFTVCGGGLSFNTGKGIFADDGKLSRARFNLWIVPIDLFLGTRVSLGRNFSISVAGGPSIAAAFQNRSDREDGDDDKRVRQVGFGYGAMGSLDFSLSQMFKNYGVSLKGNSEISDFSISLMVKNMTLSNFKTEDFEITGNSFGIGFNFELL